MIIFKCFHHFLLSNARFFFENANIRSEVSNFQEKVGGFDAREYFSSRVANVSRKEFWRAVRAPSPTDNASAITL